MVEYKVEDRGNATDRELFCLLTTLTDPLTHPAPLLAYTYAERRDELLVQGERETDSERLVNCGTVQALRVPRSALYLGVLR